MILNKVQVREVVSQNPGHTAKELVQKVRAKMGSDAVTRKDVNQTLYALEKENLVTRHQVDKEAPTWEVTDENFAMTSPAPALATA